MKYYLWTFMILGLCCSLMTSCKSSHPDETQKNDVASAEPEKTPVNENENQDKTAENAEKDTASQPGDKKYANGIINRKTYFYYANEGANDKFTLQKLRSYESFQVSIYEIWTDEAEKLGLVTQFGKSDTDTTSVIGIKFEPVRPEVSMYALENFDSDGGVGYNTTVTYIPTGNYVDMTVGPDTRTLNIEYLRLVNMISTEDASEARAVCQTCRIIVNDGYPGGALKQWCGSKIEFNDVSADMDIYKTCLEEATVMDISGEEYSELYERLIGQYRKNDVLG